MLLSWHYASEALNNFGLGILLLEYYVKERIKNFNCEVFKNMYTRIIITVRFMEVKKISSYLSIVSWFKSFMEYSYYGLARKY